MLCIYVTVSKKTGIPHKTNIRASQLSKPRNTTIPYLVFSTEQQQSVAYVTFHASTRMLRQPLQHNNRKQCNGTRPGKMLQGSFSVFSSSKQGLAASLSSCHTVTRCCNHLRCVYGDVCLDSHSRNQKHFSRNHVPGKYCTFLAITSDHKSVLGSALHHTNV